MATGQLKFRLLEAGFTKKLERIARSGRDLGPFIDTTIDLMHFSVLEEFNLGVYFPPRGGSVPWKARVPFGTTPSLGKTLWVRGRLKAAWTGGAGSVTEKRKTGGGIGIDPNFRIPGEGGSGGTPLGVIAAVHRGGLQPIPREGQITVIKAKTEVGGAEHMGARNPGRFAMWHFLANRKGFHASYDKLRIVGFKVKARPHAAMNPRLATEIKTALVKHLGIAP